MDDCGGASAAKRRSCMAVGCEALLSDLPKYCVQRRLCPDHLKAVSLQRKDYGDQLWRFCQQCGKLEPLSAFDGTKRSCRAQLAKRRANAGNKAGPSASAGAAGVAAASLKPLGGGIRKVSSQGSGLDKLALFNHTQTQLQQQPTQQHLLPQFQGVIQQQQLQLQQGLLLQQQVQQQQQQVHVQQQVHQQQVQHQQQQQDLELDVSVRLLKVKQQLASLESQLAIMQEQQQVEAQLAALQQQYEHMQLQRAHSQLIGTVPAPGTPGVHPFSGPLYRVGTELSSGLNNLLLQGSNNSLPHVAAAATNSAPMPAIAAPNMTGELAFIPFMRGGSQAWGGAAAVPAAVPAAPVTAAMSAGLPPVATSSSRQRCTSALLPFPGRDCQPAVRRTESTGMYSVGGGGSGSMGNSSMSQPLQRLAGQPAVHSHAAAAAAAAEACVAAQVGVVGMQGASAGAGLHAVCSAPALHIDELLPEGDIPDLEEFLAAGGTFEPLDSDSTHNIISGDAISSSKGIAAAAGAGQQATSCWQGGGQEAAAAAAQYLSMPPVMPGGWAIPAAAAGRPAALPTLGCEAAAGGFKGGSSLDMFAGLLEDVLAEIQSEQAAAAATYGASTMHV